MAYILTSYLHTNFKDEGGARFSIPIEDTNGILTNIKKFLKHTKKLVVIANDKYDFFDNDIRLKTAFDSFRKSGIEFNEKFVLDNRNAKNAKQILDGASLVLLSGGKCLRLLNFLNEISFAEFAKSFDGVIIGVSAGTMVLSNLIANFPEEFCDLTEPRWINGLGLVDEIFIPHFDGKIKAYQFELEIDCVKNYVFPMSCSRCFTGLDNDAYILIDNENNKSYFGNNCKIENGKVVENFGQKL